MICNSVIVDNLEKLTLDNIYFRKVISTSPTAQLVLMSIQPGDSIGMESHPGITQFFRIESGEGIAVVGFDQAKLSDGSFVFVHPGVKHNIINTSKTKPLKLYTIYSPPNHPCNRIDMINPHD